MQCSRFFFLIFHMLATTEYEALETTCAKCFPSVCADKTAYLIYKHSNSVLNITSARSYTGSYYWKTIS